MVLGPEASNLGDLDPLKLGTRRLKTSIGGHRRGFRRNLVASKHCKSEALSLKPKEPSGLGCKELILPRTQIYVSYSQYTGPYSGILDRDCIPGLTKLLIHDPCPFGMRDNLCRSSCKVMAF